MCEDLTGKPVPPPGKTEREDAINHATDVFLAEEKRIHIAAAKKECGLCGYKATGRGVWKCTHQNRFSCPNGLGYGLGWGRKETPDFVCPGFLKKPSVIRAPQPKTKGLPVPEGVKFLYVGAPRGKTKRGVPQHQGVVTIAYITPAPGILHMGFSFCNPGQKGIPPNGEGNGHLGRPNTPPDRWCKATGRDMALARLIHPLVIPFLYSPKRTVHEVTRAVLSHDFERLAALTPGATMWERVPSWTRGLAKRMSKTRVVAIYRLPGSAARIIASLKEFEIKHLPLAIMAQMMRDIAALGNG